MSWLKPSMLMGMKRSSEETVSWDDVIVCRCCMDNFLFSKGDLKMSTTVSTDSEDQGIDVRDVVIFLFVFVHGGFWFPPRDGIALCTLEIESPRQQFDMARVWFIEQASLIYAHDAVEDPHFF